MKDEISVKSGNSEFYLIIQIEVWIEIVCLSLKKFIVKGMCEGKSREQYFVFILCVQTKLLANNFYKDNSHPNAGNNNSYILYKSVIEWKVLKQMIDAIGFYSKGVSD